MFGVVIFFFFFYRYFSFEKLAKYDNFFFTDKNQLFTYSLNRSPCIYQEEKNHKRLFYFLRF